MQFYLESVILVSFIVNLLEPIYSQATSIVLLDKKHENETYYYDLSYLGSGYNNLESQQTKFSIRDRSGSYSNKHSCGQIKSVPSNVRNELKLKYFYQKFTEAYGIPVVGSNKVTANGLKRACYVLRFFLASNPEIREVFYKRNVRVVVMSLAETLLSVPEFSQLPPLWSSVKGLSPTSQLPIVTIAEENIHCNNEKFKTDDLLLHQLSYGLVTLDALNSNQRAKLEDFYEHAKENAPKNSPLPFHLIDRKEYLASAIDVYLNVFSKHGSLISQDPMILSLVREIFPCESNVFLTKCKSTREAEVSQVLRQKNRHILRIRKPSRWFNDKYGTCWTSIVYYNQSNHY